MLVILPYPQEEGKEILEDCNAHTQQDQVLIIKFKQPKIKWNTGKIQPQKQRENYCYVPYITGAMGFGSNDAGIIGGEENQNIKNCQFVDQQLRLDLWCQYMI